MRRFLENGFVRGIALVTLVSLGIVLLSLESSVATAGALMRVAFFLAVAFFLFLLWRERRAELDTWSDLSRGVFYGAIALAVLAIGVYLGVGASGLETLAFVAVLAACVVAVWRVWRREHL